MFLVFVFVSLGFFFMWFNLAVNLVVSLKQAVYMKAEEEMAMAMEMEMEMESI